MREIKKALKSVKLSTVIIDLLQADDNGLVINLTNNDSNIMVCPYTKGIFNTNRKLSFNKPLDVIREIELELDTTVKYSMCTYKKRTIYHIEFDNVIFQTDFKTTLTISTEETQDTIRIDKSDNSSIKLGVYNITTAKDGVLKYTRGGLDKALDSIFKYLLKL